MRGGGGPSVRLAAAHGGEQRAGERLLRVKGRRVGPAEARALDGAAHEREAVRVYARRGQADEDVARADELELGQQVGAARCADREPREVVVACASATGGV